jgi:hypothetical protein
VHGLDAVQDTGEKYKNITATTVNTRRGLDVNELNPPQRTANNELEVVQNTSYVLASPVYNLLPSNFRAFTATGGSTAVTGREFTVTSGTSAGGYGAIQSFRSVKFTYGHSVINRFCARFPTNVAQCWQGVGLISLTDEVSFGYNGTDFGVWHRYGGEVEVRTIQVTGAAGGAENATVTINGDPYTVPLTNLSVQGNAFEIAAYLDANATGYFAEQLDDSVFISAASDGAKSLTWSFSSATATATVTRNTTGVTKTSDFTAQADWSGEAPTGFDPTKGNTYEIAFQGGYGDIHYYIYDTTNNYFHLAHDVLSKNLRDSPTLNNPSMKAGLYVASTGATTSVTTYCAQLAGFAQGANNPTRNPRAFSASKTATTTLTNILTIRNKRIYNDLVNQAEIVPILMGLATESGKNTEFELIANATLAGTTNFQDTGTNLLSEYDTSGTTVTGGRFLAAFEISGSGSSEVNLRDLFIRQPPTLSLTIAAKISATPNALVSVSLTWLEDI